MFVELYTVYCERDEGSSQFCVRNLPVKVLRVHQVASLLSTKCLLECPRTNESWMLDPLRVSVSYATIFSFNQSSNFYPTLSNKNSSLLFQKFIVKS